MPTTTSRLALQQPVTSDGFTEYRLAITANAATLDHAALWLPPDVIANRPVSTSGTPGLTGRLFLATDQNAPQGALYYDYGTGWSPALNLVDAAAGTPSLRTLGTGANQAMPGNTPIGGTARRQTHSWTMDDQTSPSSGVTILGSFFVDPAGTETVKLIEAVVHCATVGSTPSVFKVRTDHGSHGTLADVAGLTALTPSTTQTAVTPTGGSVTLAAMDRVCVSVVTAGNSLGCTVSVTTEHSG